MPHLIRPVYTSRPLNETALAESRDWGINNLDIDADIWDKSGLGEGVLVIVGDTGLTDHRDAPPSESSFNRNHSSSSTVYDRDGHGSHVAGTILAQHNNWGYQGIAPYAGYASYKLLGDNGSNSSDRIAQGYFDLAERWSKRSLELRKKYHTCIINLSIGGGRTDIGRRGIDALWEAGIVPVAAMGNSGNSMLSAPGIYSIGVGALTRQNRRADFSTYNQYTDLCAPGVGIVSFGPNNRFVEMSGTSMATPHITACLALLLAAVPYPELRTHDGLLEYLVTEGIFDYGSQGRDDYYGYGKPNMNKLMQDSLGSIQ